MNITTPTPAAAKFETIWAIRTLTPHSEGDEITVTLKDGRTKDITCGKFLYSKVASDGFTTLYYYLEKRDDTTSQL